MCIEITIVEPYSWRDVWATITLSWLLDMSQAAKSTFLLAPCAHPVLCVDIKLHLLHTSCCPGTWSRSILSVWSSTSEMLSHCACVESVTVVTVWWEHDRDVNGTSRNMPGEGIYDNLTIDQLFSEKRPNFRSLIIIVFYFMSSKCLNRFLGRA